MRGDSNAIKGEGGMPGMLRGLFSAATVADSNILRAEGAPSIDTALVDTRLTAAHAPLCSS